MMELGGFVTKSHQFTRKDKKTSKNLTSIHRTDVVACTVRYTYWKLTTKESSIRNVTTKGPILEDASQYQISASDRLNKGWGRRYKSTEGGTYGRKYINKYKDEIR